MKHLKVDPIKEGTVIDHIPANKALKVISIIKPVNDDIVTIGINFSSKKFGRKDIVKIEGRELTSAEVNTISLVAPNANVIIIRDYQVVNKRLVEIPDIIKGSAQCGNPKCITNNESMTTCFTTVSRDPVRLRCSYCERIFDIDELKVD
ncbi:MAG: aspartate carbamoyltransferase regulatory subunit [Calditrichae bacterium]|nr:aspartate carbamoyltransferase regulatory subunit [Calditrichota bacterium]MCB9057328.1 aspartate carbamoyltransferase regulatory subunit [Calditrichia bacterium]